ncbi:MAG: ABC transporter transmembrane domain-containing protein, partial [Bacilli bacterium]
MNNTKFKDILNVLFKILSNNKKAHLKNFIVWLVISILPLVVGLLLKRMLDALEVSMTTYFLNLLILLFVSILNMVFIYIGGILDTKSRFYVGKKVRSNLFSYFILQRHEINTSTLINIFNSDVHIIEEFISFSMDLINRIIYFIFAIYILGSINLYMTFFVFLPLLLIMLVVSSLGKRIKKHYHSAKDEDIDTLSYLTSMILSHNAIRYYAHDEALLQRFDQILKKRQNENIKKNLFYDLVERMVELTTYISNVVIMVFAIYFLPLKSDLGTFTLFIEYITYGGA